MKKRLAKKLEKRASRPAKGVLTPVQLVKRWEKQEDEPRMANEMALAYIRQTSFMLGVDIDRVDLLKTFGKKTGDMIVDRTDLNIRLFKTIKKLPKKKFRVSPEKHPAVRRAQELKLSQKSIELLMGAVKHPFWTNFVLEAHENPCGGDHYKVEKSSGVWMSAKTKVVKPKAFLWFTTSVPVVMLRSLPPAGVEAPKEENRDGDSKKQHTTEAWADLGHYAIRLPLLTKDDMAPETLAELEGGKIGCDAQMYAFSGNKLPKPSASARGFNARLHPHLDRPNGMICWGDAKEEFNRVKASGDLLRLLDITNLILREPVTNNWEHDHFENYRRDIVTPAELRKHATCNCWAHPFIRDLPKNEPLIFTSKT